ncbi:MAG: M15 family metallopeptidase [Clostridiales bacterium]|nr:M15 family metallopeptidase [Clostridiales bacterium]
MDNDTGTGNDSNSDNPENNPGNQEQNNAGGKGNNISEDGKQPVENVDDILVIVNKKRYLESDYKPVDLVIPNVKFSFDGEHEKKYMRKEAAEALEEFFGQAYEEGIYIFALSGYRSYNTQKWLFENRASKIGEEEANKLIARPGESEHQTGLAMDITSQSVQFDLKEKFGETEEGKWVKDNAHKFGFIIRYTKDKEDITGYNYEPWHIRYVGKEAAREIYNKGIAFEEYFD